MNSFLYDDETVDDLHLMGLKLIQKNNGFKFGIDAVLLSDFFECKKSGKIMDIGTGSGVLPILLYGKGKGSEFVGIDIQAEAIEMACRSATLNGTDSIMRFVLCDVKRVKDFFDGESFDAIITNPPYMKAGEGLVNPDPAKALARHELACTIDDIMAAAFYLLKEKGRVYMVHRPYRLPDIFDAMRNHRIEPKRMRLVHANAKEKPNLVLICGTKFGNKELWVDKPLFVYNNDRTYTDEIKAIYGIDRP